MMRWNVVVLLAFLVSPAFAGENGGSTCASHPNPIYVVPNTHGTATGWLTGFSTERNYMINNYGSFISLADKDESFRFVFSEVPTVIAMKELAPEKFATLSRLVRENKVSITNAFAVEFSPNQVTGETFLRMGEYAQDWFAGALGVTPKIAWFIDTLGMNPQIPELLDQLDVKLLVYVRNANVLAPLHLIRAQSGTTVAAFHIDTYSQWRPAFGAKAVGKTQIVETLGKALTAATATQPDAPFAWLVGASDYSPAPADLESIKNLMRSSEQQLNRPVCLGTTDEFLASVTKFVANAGELDVVTSPTAFAYNAFWANLPQIKQEFRTREEALIGAETAASIVSIEQSSAYPSQVLLDAWWMLLLNADRALLWGAGTEDPFISRHEWNFRDRTAFIDRALSSVGASLLDAGRDDYIFDPISWPRRDTFEAKHGAPRPRHGKCERSLTPNVDICIGELVGLGLTKAELGEASELNEIVFSGLVETPKYRVTFDPVSGDISSIVHIASGRRLLKGGNRIDWTGMSKKNPYPADFMPKRADRPPLGSTADGNAATRAFDGPLSVTVESTLVRDDGMTITRRVRIPKLTERIEFETAIDGVPDGVVLSAAFDFVSSPTRQTRGVPLGFVADAPRPDRKIDTIKTSYDQRLLGYNPNIAPAVRWTAHQSAGGGFAVLDRGLMGREWDDASVHLLLMNAQPGYRGKPNSLLSGKPKQHFAYAIYPVVSDDLSEVVKAAIEYNRTPVAVRANTPIPGVQASPNLVVESVQRVGRELRLRAVEASGRPGEVKIVIPWKHEALTVQGGALIADGIVVPVSEGMEGKTYTLPLAAQDVVTLSIALDHSVPAPEHPQGWAKFVPPEKLSTLSFRDERLMGHPPEFLE